MILLGYYPDWVEAMPPAKVPYTRYTHLAHAFALFQPDGTLKAPRHAAEFCRRAKAASVVPILAVGGAESGPAYAKASTEALAAQIVGIVEQNGYAGVDIDWEFPNLSGAPQKLVALARVLRQRFPKALLTAAVPGSDWNGKHYNAKALLPLLDFVNIMAYDFAGPWSAESGHNAPYSFCESAIRYWSTRGWPAHQLLLGLPSYGRGFRAGAFGERPTGKSAHEYTGYTEILPLMAKGWKKQRDPQARVPYLVSPDGKEILSYDDPESIALKAALAKKSRLAGCFFWEITQDDGTLAAAVKAT
jgi:chitinase